MKRLIELPESFSFFDHVVRSINRKDPHKPDGSPSFVVSVGEYALLVNDAGLAAAETPEVANLIAARLCMDTDDLPSSPVEVAGDLSKFLLTSRTILDFIDLELVRPDRSKVLIRIDVVAWLEKKKGPSLQ
jgi:hypothetical protein